MPFTFLAHQAPVLPLKLRNPQRWDGLGLVIGSMAPDLAYVSSGFGYLGARALYFSGHRLQNQFLLALFATLLTVVVRRLVLPVAPLVLPEEAAPLRSALLGTSARRPPCWVTYLSSLVGALTHLVIDAFTHFDGFVVSNVGLMRTPWFVVAGKEVALYHFLQYGLSVVLGVWCVLLMRRWWSTRAPTPPDRVLRRPGRLAVVTGMVFGIVAGVAVAWARANTDHYFKRPKVLGSSVILMTWCWVAFGGLLVGCLIARPFLVKVDVATVDADVPAPADQP